MGENIGKGGATEGQEIGYKVPDRIQMPETNTPSEEMKRQFVEMADRYLPVFNANLFQVEQFAQVADEFFQLQESINLKYLTQLVVHLNQYAEKHKRHDLLGFGFQGYFISGLINRSLETSSVMLDLRDFDSTYSIHGRFDALGYRLKSGIILNIYNSVCNQGIDHLGHKMAGGTINYCGSSGACVGQGMKDGEINVLNSAGYLIGAEMTGGKINIYGNLESDCNGRDMTGGEIRVRGNVAGLEKHCIATKDPYNSGWTLIKPNSYVFYMQKRMEEIGKEK